MLYFCVNLRTRVAIESTSRTVRRSIHRLRTRLLSRGRHPANPPKKLRLPADTTGSEMDGNSMIAWAADLSKVFDLNFLMQEHEFGVRRLQTASVWQTVVVALTIATMLIVIVMDTIGPDWVFAAGLMVFMVTEIVSLKDGLEGFSNSGVLTVMALFIVAEGVSRTGALDYYMGMILGKPKTIAGAQLRLIIPIGIASAFLNNTPIVAVMIPLTLRWAKTNGFPRQQLLIPLSYSTILGGTCTLVGTSTNLVVSGLLAEDYPDTPAGNFGLLDLSIYGVPNLIIGLIYIMIFAPILLPHGRTKVVTDSDPILLGAKVTPWSPAAGRTVRRSGLGNSGGIYLVNVRRAATGNMQYAVSKDFVVSVGDELFFAGSVSDFGDFCEKHGLEMITSDYLPMSTSPPDDIGASKESILSGDEADLLQLVNHLSDQIDGRETVDTAARPPRVVVVKDVFHSEGAIIVGIDCLDRAGLLMEISKALFQLGLKLRHSEAAVFGNRSLSVWRCESIDSSNVDHGELWTALNELLNESDQSVIRKKTGTRVVRAVVTKDSELIGKKPANVPFREKYRAAIVAYQKKGKNVPMNSSFEDRDLLVLQVLEGSPLLSKPPKDFYKRNDRSFRSSVFGSMSASKQNITNEVPDLEDDGSLLVWKNLKVEFEDDQNQDGSKGEISKGEFLTAFVVPSNSPLENKSLAQLGYTSLPGVVLIGIERPSQDLKTADPSYDALSAEDPLRVGDIFWMSGSGEAIGDLQKVHGLVFFENEEIKKATSVLQDRRLVQAVVARGSPLVGKTVAESRFRSQYGGAVIAVQRGSDRVHEHPGKVKLQTGDALLIQAGPTFMRDNKSKYETFALVSEVENSSPPRPRWFLLCVALITASLVVAALEIRNLLITASIVGIIMVSLGIVTQQEARDCLQWDLYMVVSCAFGIGTAMENSGVATGLATFLVNVGTSINLGAAGIYGAIYLATNLLSAILTNNAAAALMFPIAMQAVDQTGVDRRDMAIILMLASSDYMTSFGYQTNLMVYAPGGYKNIDFLKFGAPLQLILWLSSVALVATGKTWYISWIICILAFTVVAAIRLSNNAVLNIFKRRGTYNKGSAHESNGVDITPEIKDTDPNPASHS